MATALIGPIFCAIIIAHLQRQGEACVIRDIKIPHLGWSVTVKVDGPTDVTLDCNSTHYPLREGFPENYTFNSNNTTFWGHFHLFPSESKGVPESSAKGQDVALLVRLHWVTPKGELLGALPEEGTNAALHDAREYSLHDRNRLLKIGRPIEKEKEGIYRCVLVCTQADNSSVRAEYSVRRGVNLAGPLPSDSLKKQTPKLIQGGIAGGALLGAVAIIYLFQALQQFDRKRHFYSPRRESMGAQANGGYLHETDDHDHRYELAKF